jgi:RNA:NAD 2'-phosphotransferase (TPT1/KptA family)
MKNLIFESRNILNEQIANVYYHGTDKNSAEMILKEGLDPSKSKYSGTIYMTSNLTEATKYSKIASGGKLGIILRINPKGLDENYIIKNYNGIIEYNGYLNKMYISKF